MAGIYHAVEAMMKHLVVMVVHLHSSRKKLNAPFCLCSHETVLSKDDDFFQCVDAFSVTGKIRTCKLLSNISTMCVTACVHYVACIRVETVNYLYKYQLTMLILQASTGIKSSYLKPWLHSCKLSQYSINVTNLRIYCISNVRSEPTAEATNSSRNKIKRGYAADF